MYPLNQTNSIHYRDWLHSLTGDYGWVTPNDKAFTNALRFIDEYLKSRPNPPIVFTTNDLGAYTFPTRETWDKVTQMCTK